MNPTVSIVAISDMVQRLVSQGSKSFPLPLLFLLQVALVTVLLVALAQAKPHGHYAPAVQYEAALFRSVANAAPVHYAPAPVYRSVHHAAPVIQEQAVSYAAAPAYSAPHYSSHQQW